MFRSLPLLVLDVLPLCPYTVLVTPTRPEGATFDDRGLLARLDPLPVTLVGLVQPATAETLTLADEGVVASGAITFTTRARLMLPGRATRVPLDTRYVLIDDEGLQWKLIQRKRIGCVNEYLGVPFSESDYTP